MTTFNNMNISSPAVDSATYNTTVDDAFQKIDEHDHTNGRGVQIPTAGIEDAAITGAKLDSAIVDDATIEIDLNTLQVKDGGIDTTQLADGSVETAKIADDSVTTAKMAINYALSSEMIDDTVTASSPTAFQDSSNVDVTVDITIEGDRDLELSLVGIADNGPSDPQIELGSSGSGSVLFSTFFQLVSSGDDYTAGQLQLQSETQCHYPPSIIKTIIPAGTLSAGAKTFKFRASLFTGGSGSIKIDQAKIMAREL